MRKQEADTIPGSILRAGDYRPRNHPLRAALTNEVHARPSIALAAPLRGSMLAMLSGEAAGDTERAQLERLCEWAGVPRPALDATHYYAFMGSFHLRWERHTEFSTWTILRPGFFVDPFAEPALHALPADWIAGLPGELLVGIHIAVLGPAQAPPSPGILASVFGSEQYVGSNLVDELATVWTDFRIHGDGFSRILLADHGMSPGHTGRVAQRLLEIETYRMLALLALPLARSVLPRIGEIERELASLIASFAQLATLDEEAAALARLTRFAARNEQIAAETTYRFAAARAYYELVERRISELRETRVDGMQTIGEFMERRLLPAMRTCEAVDRRCETLSRHIARAGGLLRTRVEVALEGKNAELLRSMDQRADVQLRLQHAVEGLSVVAISYYSLALVSHALQAAHAAGLPINPEIADGIAIPVILGAVWLGLLRIRKVIGHGHRH
ncbi:MAG TPA: DUF3422 domain-containing protein [Acetobacteraceae bacterium]|nr:DUF3422 domain-containing protein [Acetobacteraceae bacterium]